MHIAIAIRVRDQMLGCASLISGIVRPAKECCPLIIAGGRIERDEESTS